jgi:hypothetical protein
VVDETHKKKLPNYRRGEYCAWEKFCPRCKEWWPADREFYYKQNGGLSSWCKACITNWKQDRRRRGVTDKTGRLVKKASV